MPCYTDFVDQQINTQTSPPPVSPQLAPIQSPPIKKRSFLLISASILLIIFLSLATYFLLNYKKSSLKISASLVYAEGEVEYQKSNTGWKTAFSGLTLSQGDWIRVLTSGKAILNFDDGSSIRLNTNTVVRLTDLSPDNMVITNNKGEIYARVSQLDRSFIVQTANASYQAMGTAFKTVNQDDLQGVEVYQSQVKILGVNSNDELLIEQGNKYYLVNISQPDIVNSVTAINLDDVKKDDFLTWNKQQDEKIAEFKDNLGILINIVNLTPTITPQLSPVDTIIPSQAPPTDTPAPTKTPKPTVAPKSDDSGQITLTATATGDGISFNWTVTGIDSNLGFKLVKGTDPNPVYPGNDYQYLSTPSIRQYTWKITDGKTYHFRVCRYLGSSCGVYSNDITVQAPSGSSTTSTTDKKSTITSLSLVSNGGGNISWTTDGYSSMGFKVVWSKNSQPTYPLRNDQDRYHYESSPDTRNYTINAFSGSGTYFVRVCQYLGGSCGLYSNEIQVNL